MCTLVITTEKTNILLRYLHQQLDKKVWTACWLISWFIYILLLTGKPERFTVWSSMLISIRSRQCSTVSDRPECSSTDQPTPQPAFTLQWVLPSTKCYSFTYPPGMEDWVGLSTTNVNSLLNSGAGGNRTHDTWVRWNFFPFTGSLVKFSPSVLSCHWFDFYSDSCGVCFEPIKHTPAVKFQLSGLAVSNFLQPLMPFS